MKRNLSFVLIFGLLAFGMLGNLPSLHAERLGNAPQKGVVVIRDSSSTNIPTTYTTGAGFASSVTGKSHVKVINKSSADLGISLSTTTTNCSGGVDNDVVAASGASVSDFIFVNSTVCIRSLSGSAVTSGMVYLVLF